MFSFMMGGSTSVTYFGGGSKNTLLCKEVHPLIFNSMVHENPFPASPLCGKHLLATRDLGKNSA